MKKQKLTVMFIPNTPINAKIIKSNNASELKLKRIERGNSGIYDLTIESLCLLVDKSSGGKINEYMEIKVIDFLNTYAVGSNSIDNIAEFLYKRFNDTELHQLFGNVRFYSANDIKDFFKECKFYSMMNLCEQFNDYMFAHYKLNEGKLVRI